MLSPSQILCWLLNTIGAFCVIDIELVAVQPVDKSVTVTVYKPDVKPERSSVVAPLLHR